MQTMVSTPDSIASKSASVAKRGGTKTMAVLAPVSSTASAHRVEDGDALDVLPGLAGGDAGDDLGAVGLVAGRVERALAAGDALHHEAGLRVDQDAHAASFASSTARRAAESIVSSTTTLSGARSAMIARPSSSFGPVQAHHDRQRRAQSVERGQEPLGHLVAAGDATEDVDQERLHLVVGQEHLERGDHVVGLRAAAGVEEVRRAAARQGDHVERAHDEAGAVAEDADVAVELDVGDAPLLRHPLLRVRRDRLGQRGQVGVAIEGVAVDRHLGVQGDHLTRAVDDQRVDLEQHGVEGDEAGVQALEDVHDAL